MSATKSAGPGTDLKNALSWVEGCRFKDGRKQAWHGRRTQCCSSRQLRRAPRRLEHNRCVRVNLSRCKVIGKESVAKHGPERGFDPGAVEMTRLLHGVDHELVQLSGYCFSVHERTSSLCEHNPKMHNIELSRPAVSARPRRLLRGLL